MDYKFQVWCHSLPEGAESLTLDYRGRSNFSPDVMRTIFSNFTKPFNEPIVNLWDIEQNPRTGALSLGVGDSLFADHEILNKTNYLPNGREIALEQRVLPLTVICLTVTSDDKVIFGKKDSRNGSPQKTTLLPSGYMDIQDRLNVLLSPAATSKRELTEETGIPDSHVQTIRPYGLVFSNNVGRGFTIPYKLGLDIDSNAVKNHFASGHDREVDGIELVPYHPEFILSYVQNNTSSMSNHALGALLTVGKQDFGLQWQSDLSELIRKNYGNFIQLPDNSFATRKDVRDVVRFYPW